MDLFHSKIDKSNIKIIFIKNNLWLKVERIKYGARIKDINTLLFIIYFILFSIISFYDFKIIYNIS